MSAKVIKKLGNEQMSDEKITFLWNISFKIKKCT